MALALQHAYEADSQQASHALSQGQGIASQLAILNDQRETFYKSVMAFGQILRDVFQHSEIVKVHATQSGACSDEVIRYFGVLPQQIHGSVQVANGHLMALSKLRAALTARNGELELVCGAYESCSMVSQFLKPSLLSVVMRLHPSPIRCII